MPSRIQILPEKVANQIAAGEVIERPASVVKELVENALDAMATRINIEVRGGGQSYIRVTDNGCGMNSEEVLLAFERHATSKIVSLEDLTQIQTFGFRGEALPGIASISKIRLTSKTAETLTGVRVEVHGSKVLKVEEVAANSGTSLEVQDLFYNTPARLKFLKSTITELSHISEIVIDEALAQPEVSFSLIHNTRETIQATGNVRPLERIVSIFGKSFARELIQIHQEAGRWKLTGFLGLPSFHRTNRNYQKIFVNRRPVRDRALSHAIQEAYETLIPKGRYPVAILFLQVPLELVDVNVHPAKAEVRFVDQRGVHAFIVDGIRKTLRDSLGISAFPSLQGFPISSEFENRELKIEEGEESKPIFSAFNFQSAIPSTLSGTGSDIQPPILASQPLHRNQPYKIFSTLSPIGQFHRTYILAQTPDELILIDQHAAHERVVYEELKRKLNTLKMEVQPLLFPITLELSYREGDLLMEHLEFLGRYGLELEHFGGSTYLLKAVPTLLTKVNYQKLMTDIVDQLAGSEKSPNPEKKMDQVITLIACHAAIRANDPLTQDQITALLQQMDQVELPYTCPHGRPTITRISLYELEKKFRRI
jgi:DNA mismatch repair protein MutL